eukprot:scaffold3169_cov107-Cylindrotheca_fusiformis.AAC.7
MPEHGRGAEVAGDEGSGNLGARHSTAASTYAGQSARWRIRSGVAEYCDGETIALAKNGWRPAIRWVWKCGSLQSSSVHLHVGCFDYWKPNDLGALPH